VSASRRPKIDYRSSRSKAHLRFFFFFLQKPFEREIWRVEKERRAKDVVMEILLDVVMEKNSLKEKTSSRRSVMRTILDIWTILLQATVRGPVILLVVYDLGTLGAKNR
jgi:hypothetical protein